MPADAGVPSITSDVHGRRPFVHAIYADGQLTHSILDCPFAAFGEACSVSRKSHRHRKTGPTHPLVVLRCHVHEQSFTVYPLGFVPYSRRQLIDGPVQHDIPSLMEVVDITAVDGPHSRHPIDQIAGSWSTQLRLVDLVTRLFGLGSVGDSLRVSNAFGIALTDLVAASVVRGCQAQALALQRLATGLSLDDLLVLGALMGCWGRPYRWYALRDQLIALPLSRGPPTTLGRGVGRLAG